MILKTTLLVICAIAVISSGLSAQKAREEAHPKDLRVGRWKTSTKTPQGYKKISRGRYELQTNCDKELADQTLTHLNAMAKVFKTMLPQRKTLNNRMVVKLFRSRKNFMDYGAPPGAAAYYSPSSEEMVGFDTGMAGGKMRAQSTTGGAEVERWRQRMSMDVLGVMCHEGWHQFFHFNCGSQVHFPAWCDEGIAEYFYSAYVDPNNKKKFVVGSPNDVRLSIIQNALERDTFTPLKDFVEYEQRRYYANSRLHYPEGALFVHFLMEHPKYKKKKYVQRFVKIFIDQHSIEKTIPRVFGKKPKWDAMTRDFKDWTLAIPRVVDPLDPFAAPSLAFNKRAKKRFEALEPAVRKALQACIDKRMLAPWQLAAQNRKISAAKKKKLDAKNEKAAGSKEK